VRFFGPKVATEIADPEKSRQITDRAGGNCAIFKAHGDLELDSGRLRILSTTHGIE